MSAPLAGTSFLPELNVNLYHFNLTFRAFGTLFGSGREGRTKRGKLGGKDGGKKIDADDECKNSATRRMSGLSPRNAAKRAVTSNQRPTAY